jgi:hypothetical protein
MALALVAPSSLCSYADASVRNVGQPCYYQVGCASICCGHTNHYGLGRCDIESRLRRRTWPLGNWDCGEYLQDGEGVDSDLDRGTGHDYGHGPIPLEFSVRGRGYSR